MDWRAHLLTWIRRRRPALQPAKGAMRRLAPGLGALLLGALLIPAVASGQAGAEEAALKMKAMERVAFLVGEWEGEGWMMLDGERHSFRGTESVTALLDGRMLIIEGRHFAEPTGELVHHAVAVLTYDPGAGSYWFRMEVAGRGGSEARGRLVEDAFRWEMRNRWGEMRYTARLDDDGNWVEVGEMSRDGETWVQHFEMTMRRREDG